MILKDENGNTWDTEYFSSEEAARKAMESCSGCSRCSNCYGCSDCSRCSDCSGCSRCSNCYGCSRCSGCSNCYGCSRCSDCSGCSDCYGCSRCSDCSDYSPTKITQEIPAIENIHQKVFDAVSQPGALEMGAFHTCETTHCRAGWVIHLAGKAGYDLEKATSPEFAAMQIYKKSGYEISPARFYDSNEIALEDMKRLAESK